MAVMEHLWVVRFRYEWHGAFGCRPVWVPIKRTRCLGFGEVELVLNFLLPPCQE